MACGPDTNLGSVIETMKTDQCGIVPVVNERGEAVGIVSIDDIVRWAALAPGPDPLRIAVLDVLAGTGVGQS